MPPIDRSERLNVRIAPEEMAMLQVLADESGLTASDIVRTLIRREYGAKFSGSPPHQAIVRAALDAAGRRAKRQDIRGQIEGCIDRRRSFDARHKQAGTGIALAVERMALDAIEKYNRSGSSKTGDDALIVLEELFEFYTK
jgi:hypothetical protein